MTRQGLKKSSLVLLFALFAGALTPAVPVSSPLPGPVVIKAWMVEDGLPQNTVLAFVQTPDGILWFGTEMGLVRFNGANFRVYNTWNTPPLPSNRITALCPDARGGLWVGTDAGLALLRNEAWQGIPGSARHQVLALAGDTAGTLWIGTREGLWRYAEGRLLACDDSPQLRQGAIAALLADQGGRIWVASTTGLYVKEAPATAGFRQVSARTTSALGEGQDRRVWLASGDRIGFVTGDLTVSPMTCPGRAGYPVTCLAGDRQGDLWVGTAGDGALRISGTGVLRLGGAEGLPDEYIHTICEDYEGNLWLGTASGGISRVKPRVAGLLDRHAGLPENTVSAVLAVPGEALWLGTRHRGLVRWSPPGAAAGVPRGRPAGRETK